MEQQDIISSAEAGRLLGISDETVRKLAERGDLPGWKPGVQWRFRRADVEAYLTKCGNAG